METELNFLVLAKLCFQVPLRILNYHSFYKTILFIFVLELRLIFAQTTNVVLHNTYISWMQIMRVSVLLWSPFTLFEHSWIEPKLLHEKGKVAHFQTFLELINILASRRSIIWTQTNDYRKSLNMHLIIKASTSCS